jgi:hypothetical protein
VYSHMFFICGIKDFLVSNGVEVVFGVGYMSIYSLEGCLIIVRSRKFVVSCLFVGVNCRAGCMQSMWSEIASGDICNT